jgi:hypothetical protein
MPTVKTFRNNVTSVKSMVTCPFCLKKIKNIKKQEVNKMKNIVVAINLTSLKKEKEIKQFKPMLKYIKDKKMYFYKDEEIKIMVDKIISNLKCKNITPRDAIEKIEKLCEHIQIEPNKYYRSCLKRIENVCL